MTALPENKLKPVAVALEVAAGVLIIAGLAYLFLTPKSYMAKARIKVIHWINAKQADDYSDLQLVSAECDVLHSNAVLDKAIENLNLRETWGKRYHQGVTLSADEARARLNSQLLIEPVIDSELIDIRVKSDDQTEPATIANGLAQVYLDLRGMQHDALLEQKRAALKQQWTEQNDKLIKAQAAVDQEYFQIVKERSTNQIRVYDANGYVSNRVRIEAQYVAEKNELGGLKRMDEDERAQVLSSMETNSAVLPLLSQLNKARSAQLEVKLTQGPDSREFKDAALVVDRIHQEISRYLAAAMALKEDKLTALKSTLAEMDATVKSSSSNLEQANAEYAIYTNALQNLMSVKQERDNLEQAMKSAQLRLDTVMPSSVTAQLIDSAETPSKPYIPNGGVALDIMATGGLSAVAGLIVLLVGQRRANVATAP